MTRSTWGGRHKGIDMKPKYAIHPDFITSQADGDFHFIGIGALVHLYKLKPGEYIVWDDLRPETYLGRNSDDYMHLYPRNDGDYRRSPDD